MFGCKILNINGAFHVYNDDKFISEHTTNAQAWKALDRIEREPVNSQEATSIWIEEKILKGD